jgi:hypothetical protein
MRNVLVMLGMVLAAMSAGCRSHHKDADMDLHAQGIEEEKALRKNLDGMVDSALLQNMAIADIHFVPHTDELNSLGVKKLTQMARLVETYGGTIHYETQLRDPDLVNRRMVHARDYLTTTGIDISRLQINSGASRGRGMLASDAIAILRAESTSLGDDSETPAAGGGQNADPLAALLGAAGAGGGGRN